MAKLKWAAPNENLEIDKLNPRKDNEPPFVTKISVLADKTDKGPRDHDHRSLVFFQANIESKG
ncbi:MAG TPA: hypothetical protein VKE91_11035 [Blastocatellia bacterium]|nr:hypothetical protein [Blastocatellia bacterium]